MKLFYCLILFSLVVSCHSYEAPYSVLETAEDIEKEEFLSLMKQDSINKQYAAAESLEILLGDNHNSSRISLIINNGSACDVIVRLAGDKSYRMPIPANGRNFIVIPKGKYEIRANLCGYLFSSTKIFTDSVTMRISDK